MTGWRIVQVIAAVVAVVMVVLLRVGTTSEGVFVSWIAVLVAAGLMIIVAQRAGDRDHARKIDNEFRRRNNQ